MFGRTRENLQTAALYDLLPALAVIGLAAVDIVQWTGSGHPTNAQRLSYPAVLALGFVGMLVRRRAPLTVLVTLAVVFKGWDYLFFAPAAQIPFAPFLIMLVLAYNTGAHTRNRKAVVGAVVLLLFMASGIWNQIEGRQLGQQLGGWVVMTVAWLIGTGLQRYRNLTISLRAQARQLQQEREERALLAVALERTRIARELHDVIAHSVSVMVIQAAAERKVLSQEQHKTREVLEMIERTGRQALVELRRMVGVLRKSDEPLLLAPQPGLPDLDSLLDQVREAGLPVAFRIEGSRGLLPAGVELSAYRIVQEALTNALKHAGRARAEVTVRYFGDRLELVVADDGGGSAEEGRSNSGHGLVGMRERVAMLGGSLQAGPRESGGFLVCATLPLET